MFEYGSNFLSIAASQIHDAVTTSGRKRSGRYCDSKAVVAAVATGAKVALDEEEEDEVECGRPSKAKLEIMSFYEEIRCR